MEQADAYCLFDDDWHEGIVGLVATRIKDRVNRPVIAFARATEPGMLKGSARSVRGIHIRDVLDAVAAHHPGLVPKFGGHAMAAGLSLKRSDDLDRFRHALNLEMSRYAQRCSESARRYLDGWFVDGR